MGTPQNPAWAELVQLVPVVSLALPFIVRGEVDLNQAGRGFVIAAVLTVPVTLLVALRGHLLNPILIGTGLWLWLGALAFGVPIEPIAAWVSTTQAFGLFAAALGVGVAATLLAPHGYVACRSRDDSWTRRASFALLGLTVGLLAWAWWFRHDVRLGGGVPFIALNVVRRVFGRFAPTE